MMQTRRAAILFWSGVGAFVAAARLCHANLLWPDEDYHLAAAIQILHGKALYRDVWYDKPPLSAAIYALLGAPTGWTLRFFDALFATASCWLAYRFAAQLWSRREGFIAAPLLACFLVFDAPSAVIPLEPDTLLLAPNLAAVYLARRRRPFWAGLVCGVAFLLNAKAVFVLAACAVFDFAGWPLLVLGFLFPNIVALGWLQWIGALPDFSAQVWRWGLLYAADPEGRVTMGRGLQLMLNWAWLHGALLIPAAAWFWWRERDGSRVRLGAWAAISLVAVAVGWRFYPHYFMQILPPLTIMAARGMAQLFAQRRTALITVIAVTMIIAVVRFNPFRTRQETDMGRDSKNAVRLIEGLKQPGDTIFIWGSRPDIVALTRLPIASRLWDSQPLTGVPADRHIATSRPLDEDWARENRQQLTRSRPTILVDGLTGFNLALGLQNYPDLAEWFKQYCPAASTGLTVVYRLCDRH
jgi:4-amino-4-deoxy-L-arabinose transferase-like glycosyltransferase